MDDMLRIPKDRPKRHPLILVVVMAVTILMFWVTYRR